MQRGRLLLAAGLVALACGAAQAGPDGEQEAPGKAVTRLARGFLKLKSYAADVTATGGTGDPKTLRIGAATANESYQLETHGPLTRFSGGAEAFRVRQGQAGVVREGALWKGILATDTGRKVERLVVRPEQLLAEVERSKKTARWVPPAAGAPGPGGPVQNRADGDEAPAPGDGTRERGDDAPAEAPPAAPLSHHLRVVGDPQIAVETFNRVANSGCFGGG